MPKKRINSVDEKIKELENIDLDSIELKEVSDVKVEKKPKKQKKDKKDKKKKEKIDPKANLTEEQKEIIKLKSQLMQERIKNVGRKKEKNFITKKKKRTFRDTSSDSKATKQRILPGAGLMIFAFGMLALIILIIRH